MEKLDEKILQKIEAEIGMTGRDVKEDISIIRNWVNQQPHLPTLKDDEETNEWLYNYLFYSKNKIEKVKRHLETYFTCKSLMPEFFENRNPESPELKSNVKALYLVTLPKLTPEGYRLHVFCHAVQDPNAYEPKDFMRRSLMMCDWKMKNDLTSGDIIIFHMKYSSLAHWSRYNLVTLSRFVAALTNAYPLRIKAVHFTQAPSFLSHAMNNLLATAKLKKRHSLRLKPDQFQVLHRILPRGQKCVTYNSTFSFSSTLESLNGIKEYNFKIHIHSSGNILELLKEIPEYCLPKELGGSLDATLDELNDKTYKNILEMREWFLANENMRSTESKRTQPLQENSMFGCEGTFRNLTID